MDTEHAPPAEDVKALRTLADFHVLDSTSLGVDHVFLGHRLAHSWGLSETLCKAIEHHHHTAGDPAAAGAARESMNLVALGELAEMVTADANGTAPPDEEDQWVISHFKLSHDDFTKVAKDVREFIAGHS